MLCGQMAKLRIIYIKNQSLNIQIHKIALIFINITLCILYTKHQKIFTSIKKHKNIALIKIAKTFKEKKNPQTIKRKSHSYSNPKYANSNSYTRMHSPVNAHH